MTAQRRVGRAVSDDLTIAGGGFTAVGTAELFEHSRHLHRAAEELHHCAARVESINRAISFDELRAANTPFSAITAERNMREAQRFLWLSAVTARGMGLSLILAAEAYGSVERTLTQMAQAVSAKQGYALGFLFPSFVFLFGPATIAATATMTVAFALQPRERKKQLLAWLQDQNEVLTNPTVVALVRMGVMSADDFVGGVGHINPDLMNLLGDEGLGLMGSAATTAAIVGTVGPFGVLAETPVRVSRASTKEGQSVVNTLEERAKRIPQGENQIRIDRNHVDGAPDTFEIYIGGTKDFGLIAGSEPWDMTSNANSLAMGDPGSTRAVQEAMRQAGVTAESPVQFSGHSQGALIAAGLAGSGEYNAQGMFTVGGPVSQVLVPEGVPWLAIEHKDDLVTGLAGNRVAPEALLVSRDYFAGETVPADTPLPAHELLRYRETAALADASEDGRTGNMVNKLNSIGAGATSVTTTTYVGRRTD